MYIFSVQLPFLISESDSKLGLARNIMNRLNSAQKTIFITDSNKRMSDALEEFEKDGKLSNYNTDGVSTQRLVFRKITLLAYVLLEVVYQTKYEICHFFRKLITLGSNYSWIYFWKWRLQRIFVSIYSLVLCDLAKLMMEKVR